MEFFCLHNIQTKESNLRSGVYDATCTGVVKASIQNSSIIFTPCLLDLTSPEVSTVQDRILGNDATHSTRGKPASGRITAPIWQPPVSITSATTPRDTSLFTLQNHSVHTGHDTGRRKMLAAFRTFQLRYLNICKAYSSRNRFLVFLSCPYDMKWRSVFRIFIDMFSFSCLFKLVLLLSVVLNLTLALAHVTTHYPLNPACNGSKKYLKHSAPN